MEIFKTFDEPIKSFIARVKPSETSPNEYAWIYCCNQVKSKAIIGDNGQLELCLIEGRKILDKLDKDLRAQPKLFESLHKTKNQLREEAVKELCQLAVKHGQTCGKWCIFPRISDMDAVWAKIVKATVEGRLGYASKINPCKDVAADSGLVCVYVQDFRGQDVKECLEELVKMRLSPQTFKLDLYTHLDLYSRNKYGIKAGLFTPKDFLPATESESIKLPELRTLKFNPS